MKVLCITGPSGSGKTTIANILKEKGYPELVSTTTRPRRVGEVDGVAYHFVSEEEFENLEKVEESFYSGNRYGLTEKEVQDKLEKYKVSIFVSDIHGIKAFKEAYPGIVKSVFLDVTIPEMEARMLSRGDTRENVDKRLAYAKETKELENGKYCDFIVRNEKLEDAVQEVLTKIKRES